MFRKMRRSRQILPEGETRASAAKAPVGDIFHLDAAYAMDYEDSVPEKALPGTESAAWPPSANTAPQSAVTRALLRDLAAELEAVADLLRGRSEGTLA